MSSCFSRGIAGGISPTYFILQLKLVTALIPALRQISATNMPSAPCFRMNPFCASVNLDALLGSTPPASDSAPKILPHMLQFSAFRAGSLRECSTPASVPRPRLKTPNRTWKRGRLASFVGHGQTACSRHAVGRDRASPAGASAAPEGRASTWAHRRPAHCDQQRLTLTLADEPTHHPLRANAPGIEPCIMVGRDQDHRHPAADLGLPPKGLVGQRWLEPVLIPPRGSPP